MVVYRRGPDGEAIGSEYEANLQRLLGNNCANEIFAGTLTKLDGASSTTDSHPDPSQVYRATVRSCKFYSPNILTHRRW